MHVDMQGHIHMLVQMRGSQMADSFLACRLHNFHLLCHAFGCAVRCLTSYSPSWVL